MRIKQKLENLLDLCNYYLNRGDVKLNTEELVSIIYYVDHGDSCSSFNFEFMHNLFPASLCQSVSCFMKLLLEDAAVFNRFFLTKELLLAFYSYNVYMI